MPQIYLQPIARANWKACIQLAVDVSQASFVPSNLYSIAEAQFYPDARPLAVYNQAHQMVGFILYGRDEVTGKWKIFRMMVDVAQQRKGYGWAAMKQVIAEIASQADGAEILICYHNANHTARMLYARLGFVEQSIDAAGKVTALLRITDQSVMER